MEIKMSNDLAVINGVNVIVYASAGMGKTMLCATAPKPIILSAESGLLSLATKNIIRTFGEDKPFITYNIPVIQIRTMMELEQAYQWICKNIGKGYFETVCIDSLSEIAEVCLSNIKSTVRDGRQQYGELLEQMLVKIKDFRALACNVYMSCKVAKLDDAVGGILHGPGMPGRQLGPALPFLFDEIFYLTIGENDRGEKYRVLQTGPGAQYDGKDRSGCLEFYEYPNLTNIFNKILEG